MKYTHVLFKTLGLFIVNTILLAQQDISIDIGEHEDIGFTGKGILPDQGVNDPHIHIFGDSAYLFASHDAGTGNSDYTMKDWNIYSSQDLIHWKKEFVLKPEDTYIGKQIDKCFATDGATRNGKYYFYFSNFNLSTGVAVSDAPGGPYVDALGKALLPESIIGNKKYDPTIFIDDDGKHYIIWGYTGWGTYYQIAELNEDMISLKTEPKNLVVTDDTLENDASYLHKHNGIYYLNTHHGKYCTSENLYGPYVYRGEIEAHGDHGTFFTWHNQTYYTAGGWQSPYFRYTYITYAHYKKNGEIVAQRVLNGDEELGVGRYNCSLGKIEAECFFAASDSLKKVENNSGFEIQNVTNGSYLFFPRVYNYNSDDEMEIRVSSAHPTGGTIEVREGSTMGTLVAIFDVAPTGSWENYQSLKSSLPKMEGPQNFYFVFKGGNGELMRIDWFKIGDSQAIVEASISFDDNDKYKKKTYVVGDSIEVTCNYHAGTGNTVTNSENGIKILLRELNSDLAVVKDYAVSVPEAIGTESGSVTVKIPTTGIPSGNQLDEGNFYYLFILFQSSNGKKYNAGVSPINIVSPVSSNRNVRDTEIVVFPNPATNKLFVKPFNKILQYKISDVSGYTVQQGECRQEIEISNLNVGLYFITFNNTLSYQFIKK